MYIDPIDQHSILCLCAMNVGQENDLSLGVKNWPKYVYVHVDSEWNAYAVWFRWLCLCFIFIPLSPHLTVYFVFLVEIVWLTVIQLLAKRFNPMQCDVIRSDLPRFDSIQFDSILWAMKRNGQKTEKFNGCRLQGQREKGANISFWPRF